MHKPKPYLLPLSWLYKAGVLFRHRLFDWGVLKKTRFDIPVVCIGNITVGGTGKTPMGEMLLAYLGQFHHVALLSRGYGRRTKGYMEVQPDAHYRDVGDEPLQVKRKFPEAVVAVSERRVEGIRRLQREHPEVDLILLDDAFQHRYVTPKVNIIMIDATRPIQHDHLLPAGSLRDLPSQLHRANYFIVTKCPPDMAPIDRRILQKVLKSAAYQRIYFTRFEAFRPRPLFPADATEEGPEPHAKVIALSGIGNPHPFVNSLKEHYQVVETVEMPDHHVYRVRDMRLLGQLLEKHPGSVVVMTEKDAVKLDTGSGKIPARIRRALYYQPVNLSFIDDSETDFLHNLAKDVRGNQTDSNLLGG